MLTRPDKGWAWVVLVASFGSHFLTGGLLFSTGVVNMSLLVRFSENHVKTSTASGLYVCFMSLSGIFASLIINRFSCRVSFIGGSLVAAAGYLGCVFIPSLDGVIILYGLIAGSGTGICYTTQLVVISLNFDKQRNLATGIASAGACIGGFVLAQPIQMAWLKYGDEGYFFILSGIALNVCVFGSLCFPSYLEEHGRLVKKHNTSLKSGKINKFLDNFRIFKILSFVWLCVSLFCVHLGTFLMYIHLPSFSVTKDNDSSEAAFLMSASGLFGAVSRFLTGVAANADDIDELLIYCGTLALLGIATLLFPLYSETYTGQLVYSVILGTYSGCIYVVLNTLTIKSVSLKYVATGIGTGMFFSGVGTAVGSPLAGYIVDRSGSYTTAFVVAGIAIFLGAVFGFVNEICREREQRFRKDQPDKYQHCNNVEIPILSR